ncbi:hypothetical protein BDV10DRAFT_175254 [Aspergillus recurvatus]
MCRCSQSVTGVPLSPCSGAIWDRCMVPVLSVAGLITLDILPCGLAFSLTPHWSLPVMG